MELTFGEFSSLLYIKAVCQFTLFIGWVTKTVVELINRFQIGWPAVYTPGLTVGANIPVPLTTS